VVRNGELFMPPHPSWTVRALEDRVGYRSAYLRAFSLGAQASRARDVAEEAVQEAHRRAHSPEQGFRSEEHYRSWLVMVAVNVVRDFFRRARRTRQVSDPETIPAAHTDPDRAEIIHWAIARVSEPEQTLLRGCYFEDKTYEELACAQGRSITWVWQRMRQARAQMRRLLESQGFVL
jgi:RNA polymerase sigma factor (sigma-70 family)